MICNNCNNNNIKESINYKKRFLFLYYKVYTYFCVNCDFEKIKKIRISKEDFNNSLDVRSSKANNTKYLTTDKTYNQNYKQINDDLKN